LELSINLIFLNQILKKTFYYFKLTFSEFASDLLTSQTQTLTQHSKNWSLSFCFTEVDLFEIKYFQKAKNYFFTLTLEKKRLFFHKINK